MQQTPVTVSLSLSREAGRERTQEMTGTKGCVLEGTSKPENQPFLDPHTSAEWAGITKTLR